MATSSATSPESEDNEAADPVFKTDFTVLKCNQKWEINNFSNCWMKPGEKLDSPTFSSEPNSRIKWRLSLYPTGRNEEYKEYVSLYLTLVESYKAEIRVKYKFFILNDKGVALKSFQNMEAAILLQEWDEHEPSCGEDKLVLRSFLIDSATGLLPGDKLTISCEVNAATIRPACASTRNGYNFRQTHPWWYGYTQMKVVELSYSWTISNFSFCTDKVGEYITSPIFPANKTADQKLQWELHLYPNGKDEARTGSISIFLFPAGTTESIVSTKYDLEIVCMESGQSLKKNHQYTWAKGVSTGYGSNEFTKREFLLNEANKLLPDDKLTIHCVIQYVADTVNISKDAELITLQTPMHRLLNDDLEILLKSKKFSDVTLVVGGQEFQAHKTILAARSPVFSAMFEYEPEERSDDRKVQITDFNYEVFQEMLRFIYTGIAKNLADMPSELLAAADFYILEELKFKCEQELCSKLGIENAAEMLILADKYNAKLLKTQAIDFINAHAEIVLETRGFKKMSAFYPQLIAEIGVKRLLDLKKN